MKKQGHQEPLEPRVLQFIRENHLVSGQRQLLVAVSGGPDSVCLLHILVKLQETLDIKLHVAHLNHQLRGAESEADAAYVGRLAHQLGLPATIEARDVKGYRARRHLSLEEAAREVRYNFLAEVAQSIGADSVAVGHTTDDHIETILMHLIRGTGTRGLRGLQPGNRWRSAEHSLNIIRPLLPVSRQETADYCRSCQLEPRLDTSNLSLSPLRNKIRHQLIPLLESYNPRINKALLRTARLAGDDLASLNQKAARSVDGVAQRQGETIVFNKKRFLDLPVSLQRHLLRESIEEILGSLKDIEARHIEEIIAAASKPAGKKLNLPFGLVFTTEYEQFLLALDSAALVPLPAIKGEVALKIPGETTFSGWHVKATILKPSAVMGKSEGACAPSETETRLSENTVPKAALSFPRKRESSVVTPPGFRVKHGMTILRQSVEGMSLSNLTAYLCLDKVGDSLIVRSRRPGDKFQPLGMSQSKELAEFMIDAKIPRAWRSRIPIVCSSEHIIWVVGWRLDDRAKVTADTKQVLRLEFKPE